MGAARRSTARRGASVAMCKTAENQAQFIWDVVDSMVSNGGGRYDWLVDHFSFDPKTEVFYYDDRPVQSYAMDSLYAVLKDLVKYIGEFV